MLALSRMQARLPTQMFGLQEVNVGFSCAKLAFLPQDGTFQQDKWDAWNNGPYKELCNMAGA